MSQTCSKCSHVNPDDASYCYHDGAVLGGHSANGGPVNAGAQPFPSQFVFPTGQTCRNFDQLATACQQNWSAAVGLLKQGFLASFLGGLGRADLALAAQEAARFPDQDRGLDQLLAKLPSHVLESPKLLVEPTEVNLGVVQLGTDRHFELHLANQGMRLLYGSVVSDCKWLTLGEAPGNTQKLFQFGSDATIPVQVRGQHLRAGSKPLEGHLVIESNAGAVTLTVKAEVPVKPFKEGVLAGAISPRQVAEKAKVAPKDAAVLFEKGAVAGWFKENGWTYPVQGPSASGLGAVQQFFEALGLATAPKVEVTQKAIDLRGDPGQTVRAQIEVKTQEKRPVYAHGTSDQPWLDVSKTNLNGRVATVQVAVAIPNRPGETLQGRATIQANGNQRFVIPVTVQVGRGTGFLNNIPPVVALYAEPVAAQYAEPVMAVEAVVAAMPAGAPFAFDEPVVQAIAVPAGPSSRSGSPPPLLAARGGRPRQEREEKATPFWMHLIPAALLLLALLLVLVKDFFFAGKPVSDDDFDPTPKLAIYFDDGSKDEFGNQTGQSMRYGLVVVNPKNPDDKDKKLIFHRHGGTNSTVVRIGKVDRNLGTGGWVSMALDTGSQWKGKKSVWKTDDVQVTQLVELVPGDPVDDGNGGFKRYLDTCRVRYFIENKDPRESREVGLRVMIDTLIGKDIGNDGVPFTVPGLKELVTKFHDFAEGEPIPDFVQVLEFPNLKKPGIVGYFNLKLGGDVEPPSRVSLTHWPDRLPPVWDIPVLPIDNDSAIVLYWKPTTLKPGQKREIGYSYGLGDVASKSGQLAVTIGGVKTPGQELTVTALIDSPKAGEKLTLKLPDGLKLREGSAEQTVSPPAAGSTQSPVTWRIEASRNGPFDIEVTSGSGVTQKRKIIIKTKIIF